MHVICRDSNYLVYAVFRTFFFGIFLNALWKTDYMHITRLLSVYEMWAQYLCTVYQLISMRNNILVMKNISLLLYFKHPLKYLGFFSLLSAWFHQWSRGVATKAGRKEGAEFEHNRALRSNYLEILVVFSEPWIFFLRLLHHWFPLKGDNVIMNPKRYQRGRASYYAKSIILVERSFSIIFFISFIIKLLIQFYEISKIKK